MSTWQDDAFDALSNKARVGWAKFYDLRDLVKRGCTVPCPCGVEMSISYDTDQKSWFYSSTPAEPCPECKGRTLRDVLAEVQTRGLAPLKEILVNLDAAATVTSLKDQLDSESRRVRILSDSLFARPATGVLGWPVENGRCA